MAVAYPLQRIQDWCTQQWVILRGRKINPEEYTWLTGPFGNLNGIGEEFIHQLAEKEQLTIRRNVPDQGLLPSIENLNLPAAVRSALSAEVIHFYENTAEYTLNFTVKWNPLFKPFGILVNKLFSSRIRQLNIPVTNTDHTEPISSEIITLSDPETGTVKYTVWFRTQQSSGRVIYSGIYGTCTLPSGQTCVKAIFPLPKGNATVIMLPEVDAGGALILDSSGKQTGDAGFYFLLNDAKGNYWTQFIRSFRDRLVIATEDDHLRAEQTMSLWNRKVMTLYYTIHHKGMEKAATPA